MPYPFLALCLALLAGLSIVTAPARAADTLNVYTAWPESLSQPIFKAYTAKTGVQIKGPSIRPCKR